jgi:hypothetical protein
MGILHLRKSKPKMPHDLIVLFFQSFYNLVNRKSERK